MRGRVRIVGLLMTLLMVSACGGKDPSGPVAECTEYETTLSSCFHAPVPFASQEALIPKTSADRERIRETCRVNLERLKAACR
jgi:hypothetical protein